MFIILQKKTFYVFWKLASILSLLQKVERNFTPTKHSVTHCKHIKLKRAKCWKIFAFPVKFSKWHDKTTLIFLMRFYAVNFMLRVWKVQVKEKADLSTPRRSFRIAKLKNTCTKKIQHDKTTLIFLMRFYAVNFMLRVWKVQVKEKADLSTPRRSFRIAKLKNTCTKKILDVKKRHPKTFALDNILQAHRRHQLRIWINGFPKELKGQGQGSLCFRLVKISKVLQLLPQKFAKFQDPLSTNFCQIPRRKQKTCEGWKILVDKNQSYWTLLLSRY